jgi:hypothetical protein
MFLWIEKTGVGMRERIGLSALLIIRSVSKVVLLTSMLAIANDAGSDKLTTIMAPGGVIDAFTAREEGVAAREDLIGWVNAASKSVSTYFGRYLCLTSPYELLQERAKAFTMAGPLARQLLLLPFRLAARQPRRT